MWVLDKMPEQYQTLAKQIAAITHPAWDAVKADGKPVLSKGAKQLHTRNVYQVLGRDCQSPSKMVICYAPPVGTKGEVKGGTATAVKLALNRGIDVFNLYHEETKERLLKWLEPSLP